MGKREGVTKVTEEKRTEKQEFLVSTMPRVYSQLWETMSYLFAQCSVNWACTYYQESPDKYNCFFTKLSNFLPAPSHYTKYKPTCSSCTNRTKKK